MIDMDNPMDKWVKERLGKVCIVYPTLCIMGALFTMYTCINLIDSFVTGVWI